GPAGGTGAPLRWRRPPFAPPQLAFGLYPPGAPCPGEPGGAGGRQWLAGRPGFLHAPFGHASFRHARSRPASSRTAPSSRAHSRRASLPRYALAGPALLPYLLAHRAAGGELPPVLRCERVGRFAGGR